MSSTSSARPGGRRPALAAALALALVLAASAPGAFAEPAPVRLEWTVVEGARSYLVEIRVAGASAMVYSASVAEPWAAAPLAPGDYEIRVSALNVFGKAVAVGEWTAFSVRATARLEEATLASPPEPDPSNPSLTVIRILVSGALAETVARLEGQGAGIEAITVESGASGLIASFDLSGAPAGDYDLVLENPGGYSTRVASAVRVAAPKPEPAPLPALEPGTGTELAAGTELAETPATGTELEPEPEPLAGTELAETPATGTELEPEPEPVGGTELEPEPEPLAGTELTEEPAPGTELEPEPAADPEPAGEPGLSERRAREPLPLRFDVSAGWRPSFPLDADWGGSYEAGWAGAELALGLRLAEPAPAWLRFFSIELRADAFRLPGVTGAFVDSAEALALSASLELGAAWRVLDWLEFTLRGGGALFATHVTRTGMIGDFDAWSLGDPAVQGALSTRFILGRFLAELGCAWQHVFYLEVPADFLRPFLRFGWSFGR